MVEEKKFRRVDVDWINEYTKDKTIGFAFGILLDCKKVYRYTWSIMFMLGIVAITIKFGKGQKGEDNEK